jgi:hypothetical protein
MVYSKFDGGEWDITSGRHSKFIAILDYINSRLGFNKTILGVEVSLPLDVYDGTIRDIAAGSGVPRQTAHRLIKKMIENDILQVCPLADFLDPQTRQKSRNPKNRCRVSFEKYKLIRVVGKRESVEKEHEKFFEPIKTEIKIHSKNQIIDGAQIANYYHEVKKRMPDLTPEKYYRNVKYTAQHAKKSFFPYLVKALRDDFALETSIEQKNKPIIENRPARGLTVTPEPESDLRFIFKTLTALDPATRRAFESDAALQVEQENPHVPSHSAQYQALFKSALIDMVRKRLPVNVCV